MIFLKDVKRIVNEENFKEYAKLLKLDKTFQTIQELEAYENPFVWEKIESDAKIKSDLQALKRDVADSCSKLGTV